LFLYYINKKFSLIKWLEAWKQTKSFLKYFISDWMLPCEKRDPLKNCYIRITTCFYFKTQTCNSMFKCDLKHNFVGFCEGFAVMVLPFCPLFTFYSAKNKVSQVWPLYDSFSGFAANFANFPPIEYNTNPLKNLPISMVKNEGVLERENFKIC
jgi:hypothetical protein